MKVLRAIVRFPLAAWLYLLSCSLQAIAPYPASADPDRRITVMFRGNVVQFPPGVTSGTLEDANVSSPELEGALGGLQIENIAMAFPDFGASDTLGTAWSGETVRLFDFAHVYTITLPVGADPNTAIADLSALSDVAYAEADNGITFWGAPVYPNDPYFVDGNQYGLWDNGAAGASVDADIGASGAWSETTGSGALKIAIIDSGIDGQHPEFQGRLLGGAITEGDEPFQECPNHGTRVAGIVGAIGNNGDGIAGVDWGAHLWMLKVGVQSTPSNYAAAVESAATDNSVRVINDSWTLCSGGQGCNPNTVKGAIMDAYKMNKTSIAAMGNTGGNNLLYPAGYPQGVIAVGGTKRTGERADSSTYGNHIDVMAPGIGVWSTVPGGYGICDGTSFATAFVSGVASLLYAKYPTLYNDDVQNILQLSADDIGPSGKDGFTGWGRINAQRALKLLDSPNKFLRDTAVGVQDYEQVYGQRFFFVPYLAQNQLYYVLRHEIRTAIQFGSGTFRSRPWVWGRGVGTTGVSDEFTNFGQGWCDTVPGMVNKNSAVLRTYVYEVSTCEFCAPIATVPQVNLANLASIHFNWSALEIRTPDPIQSFYVPQSGPYATPSDGMSSPPSFSKFRACPNNDAGASLPDTARLEVVVRDAAGNGIAGIGAADIFVQLNGGTGSGLQGFIGNGADSVIANVKYNDGSAPNTPVCPDVRIIPADGPTNAAGVTHITFAGPGGVREANRKWGHYDSELPVYVLGMRLQGRLTSTGGSYVLRIKNFDYTGGLGTAKNLGESVTGADFNGVATGIGVNNAISYWKDFDYSGSVTATDFNLISIHSAHDCDTPNNP